MEPKSLNVIPRVPATSPGVGTVNSISSSLPLDKLDHKSMKSNMTGISVYVWAPLYRVKRNTRDEMFPGQPDRWWLSHWPRVGPITWSGGLEYEGFLELSRGHWRAFNRGCAARPHWTKRAWNIKEICLWRSAEATKTLCRLE